MHFTDAQVTIAALVVLLVLSRIELWRERRRSESYRRALNATAIIMKESRKDG